MQQVKIANLKNNLSRYLSHVREGSEVVVLDRDTPVARIVPFAPREADRQGKNAKDDYWTRARISDLQRRGILGAGDPAAFAAWAKNHKPVKLPPGSASVLEILLQMRRESTR